MDAKQNHMEVLGYLVVGTFIMVILLLIFVPIPKASESVLFALLGALTVTFKDLYSYWFGSSKSSAEKTELLTKQAEAKEPAE